MLLRKRPRISITINRQLGLRTMHYTAAHLRNIRVSRIKIMRYGAGDLELVAFPYSILTLGLLLRRYLNENCVFGNTTYRLRLTV